MPSTKDKFWDDDRVSVLKEHLATGLSISKIADALTLSFGYLVTKGAVSGASWKYIYKYKKHPKKLLEKSPKEPPAKRVYVRKKDCIPMMPEIPLDHEPIAWPDSRYMSDGWCRSVVGSPSALKCCGAKTNAGHVYCKSHELVFYQQPKIAVDTTNTL